MAMYELRHVQESQLPETATGAPRDDDKVHDEHGARMYLDRAGRLWNHPVGQAQYGVLNLNSYRRSGDAFFLGRAETQAARLLDDAHERDGALFFPYPFDFDLHGREQWRMTAPWYSSMAQGVALRLFLRLAAETNHSRWKDVLEPTLLSFLAPRSASQPWVTTTDEQSYVWFEEYPQRRGYDQTLNGHIFAVECLYEFWRATRDPRCVPLLMAGLATAEAYAREHRRPGDLSVYCMAHQVQNVKYHRIHTRQLLSLYGMTGHDEFARLAVEFMRDHPRSDYVGPVHILAGQHQVVDREHDALAGVRTLALADSLLDADAREPLPGLSGPYYRLANGPAPGAWIREGPRVFAKTLLDETVFAPPRRSVMRAGFHHAKRFDTSFNVHQAKVHVVTEERECRVDMRGRVLGEDHVRISDGVVGGWWIPETSLVNP